MDKHKFVIISLLFVSSILFLASDAKSQESEIDRIIKEVSVDNQKGAISNYTYLMKFSYEQHKFAGRKFTRLYEAIIPSKFSTNRIYRHQLLLLEDSEKEILKVDILNARKELAKELEKDENDADNQAVQDKPIDDGGYWSIGFSTNRRGVIKVNVLQLLKNMQLVNLQRKRIDGKSLITIDFTPKTEAVFEKGLSYLSKIEGQILIDETDKRIIRIEGFAPGEFAKQKDKADAERHKEMVFLFLQTKVFEGFWFPQTVWVNFANHPEVFETIEVQFNFSDYKKASVDVKDALDVPKNPAQTSTEEKQKLN